MSFRRVKVKAPLNLGGAEFEKESQLVKRGCVRYLVRTIEGQEVLLMIVNRDDGFRIVVLGNDGKAKDIYGGKTDGK
jgi:hypothetical protein